MKKLRYLIGVLLIFVAFQSCNSDKKSKENTAEVYQCPMDCEGNKTYNEKGSCPICKMDLTAVENKSKLSENNGVSEESIFNLTTVWHNEEGEVIELKDLKGKTLIMVMIYTSCKAACPRLVADMRNIESQIPDEKIKNIQFVLVSIDPETDTPKKLKTFAKENFMDGAHWMFLQGSESSVREFANVLSVKYKEISPIDFSHSNIISVFNPQGELQHQQEGLGVDNRETIAAIMEVTP